MFLDNFLQGKYDDTERFLFCNYTFSAFDYLKGKMWPLDMKAFFRSLIGHSLYLVENNFSFICNIKFKARVISQHLRYETNNEERIK